MTKLHSNTREADSFLLMDTYLNTRNYLVVDKERKSMATKWVIKQISLIVVLFFLLLLAGFPLVSSIYCNVKGCVYLGSTATKAPLGTIVNATINNSGTLTMLSTSTVSNPTCGGGATNYYALGYNDVQCGSSGLAISIIAYNQTHYGVNFSTSILDGTNRSDIFVLTHWPVYAAPTLANAAPTSNYVYTPSAVNLTVNVSSGSGSISNVVLSSNHSGSWRNYTWSGGDVANSGSIFLYPLPSLPAGTGFSYYWSANNSNFQSNSTQIISLSILRANSTLNAYLNGNFANVSAQFRNYSVNVTAVATGGSLAVFVNGTPIVLGINYFLSSGYYLYDFNVTGGQNYTDMHTSLFVNLTMDLIFPSLDLPLLVSNLSTISSSAVNISFNASEPVNVTVLYGKDRNLSLQSWNSAFGDNTSVYLPGLDASTFYYYNLSICDQAGNCVMNGTYNFTSAAYLPSGGGGGGGGGGNTGYGSQTGETFDIRPSTVQVSLAQGQTKQIIILVKNNRDIPISIDLSSFNLDEFITLPLSKVTINPNETKQFIYYFSAKSDAVPSLHEGKIIYRYGSGFKEIPVSLDVSSKISLLDLRLSLKGKTVNVGDKLISEVTLFKEGESNKGYVTLLWEIHDSANTTVYSSEEKVAVQNQLSFIKTIQLPARITPGNGVE